MEFIDLITQQMGVERPKAEALAGGVLDLVKNALGSQADAETAERFESAIPELSSWRQAAESELGDASSNASGGLGGLLSGALGSLGGGLAGSAGAVALLMPLLGKLGLDESHVQTFVPILTQFLGQRLDGDLLQTVSKVLPFLQGEGGGAAGVLGVLGGLMD
ncbi:MAG: DUF2780 domain-containing protein [Myxococcota bacterium]